MSPAREAEARRTMRSDPDERAAKNRQNQQKREWTRRRREAGVDYYATTPVVMPCPHCGADDGRDADHARGCPALQPVPRERLLALARDVEAGWRAKSESGTRAAGA
jgi:hypothetical protein